MQLQPHTPEYRAYKDFKFHALIAGEDWTEIAGLYDQYETETDTDTDN